MNVHDRVRALVSAYGFATVEAALNQLAPPGSAPARPTDPSTSHAAAKRETDVLRFSTKNRKAKLLRVFAESPATDHEATIRVVGQLPAHDTRFEGTRRRCSDLRPPGPVKFIEDSGNRRVNPGSDSESIVWRLTADGRRALHLLATTRWSR